MCIYVKIHVSGCRIPDALCSILSSLSPSLSRTFRDVAFFFRGIHVSEIHFRGLSWKILKEFPMFPGKHILKHLFPACHAKVSKFYQSCMPPIASSSSSSFTSSSSTPPSATSSRSQWALPGLNRERQISVGLSGPNCDCQISVGTARHRERQITVGTATLYRMGGEATLNFSEKIHASLIANATWKCVQHDCQAPCGNAEKSVS